MEQKSRVIRSLRGLPGLRDEQRAALEPVTQRFEFRVSPYYAELINWEDPNDQLRRIVLPHDDELESELSLDASDEAANTHVRGLQHKYPPTALLLVTDVCASYCRFCFRKRFTLATSNDHHITPIDGDQPSAKETSLDIGPGLDYLRKHPEVDNVLLTGGDPLMLSPARLEALLTHLRGIPHVRTIRIGTKVPAFDPPRVTDEMLDVLAAHSHHGRAVVIVAQFNHPRELTELALARVNAMRARQLLVRNQSPLLRGVNDDADVLAELFSSLADHGVEPYYLFHCRPTAGNEPFVLPIAEGLEIVASCRRQLSGLAKVFRYVASQATGKIELIGLDGDRLVMRYHEARRPEDQDRVFTSPVTRAMTWPELVHVR